MGLCVSLGMVSTAMAQDDQSLQRIKDRGSIKVGVMIDFPPYASAGPGNKPDGYDAEVANMLADYLGVSRETLSRLKR